jgi:hypothetical protein
MNYPTRHGPIIGAVGKHPASKMMGRNNGLRFSLRVAEIIRVDYERMTCDLAYVQGDSPVSEEVPLTSGYWSKRAFFGAMPEKGALVVVGFSAIHQDKHVRPFIVGFLPHGYDSAKRFDPVGPVPRGAQDLNLPDETLLTELDGKYGAIRYKFRKIYPGDILAMSEKGAEILLDSDVKLFTQAGDLLHLNGSDRSMQLATFDRLVADASGQYQSGRIIRSALSLPSDMFEDGSVPRTHPLFDDLQNLGLLYEDGSPLPDVNRLPELILPNGKRISFVTKDLENPTSQTTEFYTETRTEMYETFNGVTRSIPGQEFDPDTLENVHPFLTRVSGTLVGNDSKTAQGRRLYGQVLRPVIFDTSSAITSSPRLEPVDNSTESTEKNLAAASFYKMRRPDGLGELFFSHDKEGKVFFSLPASSGHSKGLGAGRSLDGNMEGSAKLILGGDKEENISLDLTASGGLRWSLGSLSRSQRSLDLKAQGGIHVEVLSSDTNGNALSYRLKGNAEMALQGSYGLQVSGGDHIEVTTGKRDITATALSITVAEGDSNLNVLSNTNETIQGEVTRNIGKGVTTTIVSGGEDTSILSGNSRLRFASPAQRSLQFASSGTHSITSTASLNVTRRAAGNGSYAFEAPTGTYAVRLGAGSISLASGAGSLTISPATIKLQAGAISLVGSVALGTAQAPNAVVGGVPGPSPHVDFITGLPLFGNPLVRTL